MKHDNEVCFSPCKYNFALFKIDICCRIRKELYSIDTFYVIFLVFWFQIQNADDVLITPLEKFRKEQIGAAKVRDHLHKPILFIYLLHFSLSFRLGEITSEGIQQNAA